MGGSFFEEGSMQQENAVQMQEWRVDYDYISTLDLELIAGRDFNKQFSTDVDGMIIESGFAHTRPVLSALGIDVDGLGVTEEDGFGNLLKIKSYLRPTLIIHGALDQIIGVSEAGELHAECGGGSKELQVVPGADHNSIIEVGGSLYFDLVAGFVRKLGMPRRRKKRLPCCM